MAFSEVHSLDYLPDGPRLMTSSSGRKGDALPLFLHIAVMSHFTFYLTLGFLWLTEIIVQFKLTWYLVVMVIS